MQRMRVKEDSRMGEDDGQREAVGSWSGMQGEVVKCVGVRAAGRQGADANVAPGSSRLFLMWIRMSEGRVLCGMRPGGM